MVNMKTSVTFAKMPKRIWYVANNTTKQVTLVNPNTRTEARAGRDLLKANGTPATIGYFKPSSSAIHA